MSSYKCWVIFIQNLAISFFHDPCHVLSIQDHGKGYYIYILVLFTSLSSQQLSLLNAQGSLLENYKTQAKILTKEILLVNYDYIYQ